jgi:hypothetical protein
LASIHQGLLAPLIDDLTIRKSISFFILRMSSVSINYLMTNDRFGG